MDMTSDMDEKYMREALREAGYAAESDEVPVGAVIVCRGNDCTLYVTVEPCPMCAGALAWSQIGRVVYGAIDPKRGYSMFSPSLMHPKTEITAGVLADECGMIVSEFFRNKRK